MALNKDWKDYNPVTGVGDPSTPITAVALEDLEARALAAINAAVAAGAAAGRPVYTLPGTAIVLTSAHHNAEIVTTAATPVTVRVPLNWGGTGAISTGVRQDGAGAVTIVWDAGVTVAAPNGTQIRERYSARGAIVKTGTNTYVLEGDFIPASSGGGGGVITPPDGGVVPVDNEGFFANAFTNQASGVGWLVPTAGGTGDRTYVAIVAWDTGATPDISALITTATPGWVKREDGYGTGNGGAVFTADVASGGADPATLVLTWTGGNRTSFYAVVGVYDDAEYYESDVREYATQDATAPIYPSVQVQAGGQRIVAATNSAGLDASPPSGYTERADFNAAAVAQYANVTVAASASKASGALTVVPPPGNVGETYVCVVHYDNASGSGDASANIILDSSSGDWTKEATKWVSPQGSAVFYRVIAAGDVNPTVQFTGAARGVGYACIKVTKADTADPILATAVSSNASSDSSSVIFPTAVENSTRGLRVLVALNNAAAVITAPQGYTQRANFSNEGAVFTAPTTGVTADITYRDRSGIDGTGTSLTITRPAASVVGDVHVMAFYAQNDNTAVAYDVPGWTLIRSVVVPEPVTPDLVGTNYYYRVDDGSAFTPIQWDATTTFAAARIVTYSGVDTTNPIHTSSGQANAANTNIPAATITTTVDGCMLLYIGTTTDGGAVTGPATYTARNTVVYDMQVFEKAQGTRAATGTVTGTQTDASDPSMGALIALRPAEMTAMTAPYTGANRLWHGWTILLKPATTGYSTLGLHVADRAMATTGASGVLSPTMAATPNRSNVAFSVSLAPSGTVTDPDPDPDPVERIVTELSPNGSGVAIVSVPSGTESVKVAELANIADTVATYYMLTNDEWLDGDYAYTPHAGFPVVDMEALDANGISLPPLPADAWAGKLVTNVVNTPGVSADNTTIPSAASITDTAGATWTLVGGVVYRNGVATISSEVVQVLYKNSIVYQKNAYSDWWSWTNNSTAPNPWSAATDPTGAVTPPVDPPPPGGGGGGGSSGAQIIGINFSGWNYPATQAEAKAAGIGHYRIDDRGISNLATTTMRCDVMSLDYTSVRTNDKLTIGNIDPTAYANYAYNLVTTRGITRLQVLNEPWGGWFWNDPGNFSRYVAICKATYEKLAGTGTIIVGNYNGQGNLDWQNGVHNAGMLNYCHEVAVHPYGGDDAEYGGAAGDRAMVLAAFNRSGKKVAITELGYPTAGSPPGSGPKTGDSQQWTFAQQSANIASFCQWVRANPNVVSCFHYFNYRDYGTNAYYGITTGSGSAKPAYATLATYAND